MSTPLRPTAACLLGFLYRGSRTGAALVQSIQETLGDFWNVTRGQVHRELEMLSDAGLVTADDASPRDRRRYTLTDAGQAAFDAWISREPDEELIRFPLLITVFFSDHVDPLRMRRYLRSHEQRHRRRVEGYEELAGSFGDDESGAALALRFGLEYERAVLRWFGSLPWLEGPET